MERQKSIAYCKNGSVFLNTGLSSASFAKARLSNQLNDNGTLAKVVSESKKQTAGIVKIPDYTAYAWRFEETKLDDDGKVLFCGNGFSGTPLSVIIEEESETKTALAILFATAALTKCGDKINAVGAGGIILGESASGELTGDVLFLPDTLFENASQMKSESEYAFLQGFYQNKALSKNKARNFLVAVLAYRGITGVFPFTAQKNEERELDNIDNFFEPISSAINGIDENLSREIDARLFFPQKEYGEFPIEALPRELGLEATPAHTDGFVSAVKAPILHRKTIPEQKFDKKRKIAKKNREKKVCRKRFIRKHGALTGILTASALIIIALVATHIHNKGSEITTKGLSSFDATLTFYTGIQNSDVIAIHNSATGKADKHYSDIIANIYVTNKARTSYDQSAATKPLEEWLFFHNNFRFFIFGITNFTLDEKYCSLDFDPPQKNSHPKELQESDGAKETHTASYYLVANAGADTLTVIKTTDTVHLVFRGKRWQVESVESKKDEVVLDIETFRADVKSAEEKSNKSVLQEAEILREKYEWIPKKEDLLKSAEKLYHDFALQEAKSALEEAGSL